MNIKNSLRITYCSLLNKRGFTLVEILFAVTIGLLLLSAIYIAVNSGQRSSVAIEAKTAAQQDVRAALDLMAMEIGMASYNPTFASNDFIWSDLSTTSGQGCGVNASVTNPTWKGIVEASSTSLTVEADINGDGVVGSTNEPNEVIRYVYVITGGEQYITRCSCCTTSTNGSGGQPFLGDLSTSGRPRGVRVVNNVNNMPIFRYFDGNGVEIFPDANPSVIPNIRRIDITIAVDTDSIDPNTGQRRRMIYSTSVIPRNHAISQ
ncbi:hypothetical protein JZK55_10330 [Dissulfurispira thermophila]|uniref:Prepilin-type N-terminal cleavage/methylation domain-containing protein n=2 Tax=root TaxID=1 RepID=A0A7G1H1Y3_9BACT|nr:prepilin-type N-terminal cleavage/methylation domain-containing protein [Dissulfurispira thermophila]BCB96111.1 hypothetical protein JZK55_10330 [Dissulfurispira thermophila]